MPAARAVAQSTRGAEAPLKGITPGCGDLAHAGTGGPGCIPKPGTKNKRIALDAERAATLRVRPVRGLPAGSFVLLGPVEEMARRVAPLQNNQFVAASTLLFLLCWSRYVLFLLYRCGFLFLLCQY